MLQSKFFHRAAWLLALLLVACSGGAGGPVGGGMDGGGGGPGGPVGGSGNYAAGPVSLPSSANAPLNPVDIAKISCVKFPGPQFVCDGRNNSVPPNTKVEFRIFAPAAATPRDSFSVIADGEGVWTVSRDGVPGESVEICPIINGVCYSALYVVIAPDNVGVQAIPGTNKNLVIDSQGRSWHSRLMSKPSRSWTSWLIGEAHAEEAAPPTLNAECRGVRAEAEAPVPEASRCNLYSQSSDGLAKVELSFDNCNQSDITSIVSAEDPTTREPLLLVAVKRSIYVVKQAPVATVVRRYNFPGTVSAVLSQGTHYAILVASPDRPLFFLDLRNRDNPQEVGCYDLDDDLKGLKQVTSSQSLKNNFALAGFFESDGVSEYRVLVGSYVGGGTQFSQLPATLQRSASPLEVRILEANENAITVAVLQNSEKKLSFIRHPYSRAGVLYLLGATPSDATYEVPLASLAFGGAPYAVQRPQLLEVDPVYREVGFVDFTEAGTKLVTIPYNVTPAGGMLTYPRSTVVSEIGREAPAFLRVDEATKDGTWNYGGNHGQVRSVRPVHGIVVLDDVSEDS